MRIQCTLRVDDGENTRSGGAIVRVRRLRSGEIENLRAAILVARSDADPDEGDPVLFVLERGYSGIGRTVARLVVGFGVVVVMLAGVVAFLVPDVAVPVLGLAMAPAVVAVAFTVAFSARYDTGLTIRGGGQMRSEGWNGIHVVDLGSFAAVTVVPRRGER